MMGIGTIDVMLEYGCSGILNQNCEVCHNIFSSAFSIYKPNMLKMLIIIFRSFQTFSFKKIHPWNLIELS